MSQIYLNFNENHFLRLLGTALQKKSYFEFLKIVKHNYWSVKGYLTKKIVKKTKIFIKNLPNLLKNRVLEKKTQIMKKKHPNVV